MKAGKSVKLAVLKYDTYLCKMEHCIERLSCYLLKNDPNIRTI